METYRDYAEYQRECASAGFTRTPLTKSEFDSIAHKASKDTVYRIGCDVACGHDMSKNIAYVASDKYKECGW